VIKLKKMRAFVLTKYGGPEAAELHDVPQPHPGKGEVLVRVHAAGLNPVDFKIREGKLRIVQRYPLPAVMGNELAGVVEACGERATLFAEGDRVFARMPKASMGAFADYAVVPEKLLAMPGYPRRSVSMPRRAFSWPASPRFRRCATNSI
jgi:alcohol dehydrogenase